MKFNHRIQAFYKVLACLSSIYRNIQVFHKGFFLRQFRLDWDTFFTPEALFLSVIQCLIEDQTNLYSVLNVKGFFNFYFRHKQKEMIMIIII